MMWCLCRVERSSGKSGLDDLVCFTCHMIGQPTLLEVLATCGYVVLAGVFWGGPAQ